MLSKLVNLAKALSDLDLIKFLISIPFKGYLKDIGWLGSLKNQLPIGPEGEALPWVTYPFIAFIEDRLVGFGDVFEFGSGNSTLYYSRFCRNLDSVEHNLQWYDLVKGDLPGNVNLEYCELEYSGKYCRSAVLRNKKYDMIVIDGRDRVNCIFNSIRALSDRGVVILDDSERSQYSKGIAHLIGCGFKRLDFWGISPGLFYLKCTTVFYKENNVLGI